MAKKANYEGSKKKGGKGTQAASVAPEAVAVAAKPSKAAGRGKGDKVAAVAAAVLPAPVVAKVTKRSAMLTSTVLVLGDKPARNRADHIKAAFDAVAAILPATAAECLAVLEVLGKEKGMNPNGTQASYLTYWQQRGYLAEKGAK